MKHATRKLFFITGLPRSRTAWLANLFTTDDTLCFHEPTASPSRLMDDHPRHSIGISSSHLVFQYPELSVAHPAARWLYVARDPNEAARSLKKFARTEVAIFGRQIDALFVAHWKASKPILQSENTMLVKFEDLDRLLPEVWAWLMPHKPLDVSRVALLSEFKVEQRLGKALQRIQQHRID